MAYIALILILTIIFGFIIITIAFLRTRAKESFKEVAVDFAIALGFSALLVSGLDSIRIVVPEAYYSWILLLFFITMLCARLFFAPSPSKSLSKGM